MIHSKKATNVFPNADYDTFKLMIQNWVDERKQEEKKTLYIWRKNLKSRNISTKWNIFSKNNQNDELVLKYK